jgi:hypothetical protein
MYVYIYVYFTLLYIILEIRKSIFFGLPFTEENFGHIAIFLRRAVSKKGGGMIRRTEVTYTAYWSRKICPAISESNFSLCDGCLFLHFVRS